LILKENPPKALSMQVSRSLVTRFDTLLETEIGKTKDALMSAPLGDSHRHAYIKGQHEGLVMARKAYHAAVTTDDDGDGI
jgi:hypothetical protein